MKYYATTKHPTGAQLRILETFYMSHGKDPLFIESIRADKSLRTIADRFNRITDQLNAEKCSFLTSNDSGVRGVLYISEPVFPEMPVIEEVKEPEIEPARIWTVTIFNFIQTECAPWTSSFSTEEAALDFQMRAEAEIVNLHLENMLRVVVDSGILNSTFYLKEIAEVYGDDDDDEIPGF